MIPRALPLDARGRRAGLAGSEVAGEPRERVPAGQVLHAAEPQLRLSVGNRGRSLRRLMRAPSVVRLSRHRIAERLFPESTASPAHPERALSSSTRLPLTPRSPVVQPDLELPIAVAALHHQEPSLFTRRIARLVAGSVVSRCSHPLRAELATEGSSQESQAGSYDSTCRSMVTSMFPLSYYVVPDLARHEASVEKPRHASFSGRFASRAPPRGHKGSKGSLRPSLPLLRAPSHFPGYGMGSCRRVSRMERSVPHPGSPSARPFKESRAIGDLRRFPRIWLDSRRKPGIRV